MNFLGNRTSSLKLRGPTPAHVDFSLTSTPIQTITGPATQTPETIKDADVIAVTGATVLTEAQVDVTPIVGVNLSSPIVLSSLSPAVATIDSGGRVTRVADGSTGIVARTRWLAKRVDVPVSLAEGASGTIFQNYIPGSLARACADAIDNAILGKTPTVEGNLPLFAAAQANANCWASPINFDAFAMSGNATAISPLHVLYATHWEQNLLTFSGPASNQIIANRAVGADIQVGLLKTPVSSWAKLLPANYADYLPQVSYGLPVVFSNQNRTLQVGEMVTMASIIVVVNAPAVVTRQPWYVQPTSGDSGSMIGLLIGGEMVLASHWTTAGSGPNYAANIAGINAAMTALGGGYQATTVDLSSYPSYA